MSSLSKTTRRVRPALAVLLASATWVCAGASRAADSGVSPAPAQAVHPAVPPPSKKASAPAAPVKLVDINSASRDELKTLPGIDDAQAARIIAGRPYLTKADLVTSNVMPTGVYIAIKYRIVAMPAAKPVPKK
jgi:competence protein ComEA